MDVFFRDPDEDEEGDDEEITMKSLQAGGGSRCWKEFHGEQVFGKCYSYQGAWLFFS